MTVSTNELQTWLNSREDEHLEFKEAKANFHFETLVKYCVALANEGGGRMILGVTDKLPRTVVGSRAFPTRMTTSYGSSCTAIFKTRNSCVFWRRLVENKWPHSALTICW